MPRQRSEADYEATLAAIKATARQLMAEHGAAGLSLRGIARELGVTAPALYHYFESLDALITALILENFHALADAMEAAAAAAAGSREQIAGALAAYRAWALENPIDFQLIYGTPVPGYEAPAELTVPASARAMVLMVRLLVAAMQRGDLVPAPPYDRVPEPLRADVSAMVGTGDPQTVLAGYLGLAGWARLHGIVMLEVTSHITPILGDMDTFFRTEMDDLFRAMGMAG